MNQTPVTFIVKSSWPWTLPAGVLALAMGSVAIAGGVGVAAALLPTVAMAAEEPADAFIQRVSEDTLATMRADKSLRAGDQQKVAQWVDSKLMPFVDFRRMTASATGPSWRKATPEQQKRLQDEFKVLLIQTYSGALSQVGDQTLSMKPLRAAPDDKEVVVRSEVRGKGEPIQLDYRVGKASDGAWRIWDVNVAGVWLVENYRTQFAQEVNANGIDGLILSLTQRNKTNAKK